MLAQQDTISAGCGAMLPRIQLLRGPDRLRRSHPGEHGGGPRSLRSRRGKGRAFPKSGKALRIQREDAVGAKAAEAALARAKKAHDSAHTEQMVTWARIENSTTESLR